MINVRDFGAVGDWTTDDTVAFQAAAAAAMAQYDGLYIPAGAYRLTQPIELTGTGVIRGDGPSISWLIWDSGDGILYTSTEAQADFFDLSGLTLRTRAIGGKAIYLDFTAHVDPPIGQKGLQQYSTFAIKDVFVQPQDADGMANGWAAGLETVAAIYGVVRDCNFYGRRLLPNVLSEAAPDTTGLWFHGINNDVGMNGWPYVFILDNVNVAMTDVAVDFTCVEGGFLNDCNLVCVNTGVVWHGSWKQCQLNIANSHINATTCLVVDSISDLTVGSTLFFNYRTDAPDAATKGIVLSNAENVIISGNQFRGMAQPMDAIAVSDAKIGIIRDNIYTNARYRVDMQNVTDFS